jgi:hypothetical protein
MRLNENERYYLNMASARLYRTSYLSPSRALNAARERFGRSELRRGNVGIRTFLGFVGTWEGEQPHPDNYDTVRVWIFAFGSYSRVSLAINSPVRVALNAETFAVYTANANRSVSYELFTREAGTLVQTRRTTNGRAVANYDALGAPLGTSGYRAWELRGNDLPPCPIGLCIYEPS